MSKAKIGIIGGTGIYEIEGVEIVEELTIDTQWGKPSDSIIVARVEGVDTAFLPRHGRGHVYPPHQVNSRANIAALKMIGVEEILAFSAVGSLKEEIKPLDFVLPDQIIDRTKSRSSTFFQDGIVAHIAFADPFCRRLHQIIIPVAKEQGLSLHKDETLICMEGPAFSTIAESRLYKSWGAGIINMSVIPEAKLAREAEICYAMICMSTDYDCWKEDHEHVTAEMIIANLNKNTNNAKDLLMALIPQMGNERTCMCNEAVRCSVITSEEKRNIKTVEKLRTLFPEYL
ncbi:MAG: S-methyl-5'-thioadenosine phosphorylase [Spirochaetota bacterium]|nr:S-methyl-5'-thioadenosine phosphorylase [Spirochaetota bacterium]